MCGLSAIVDFEARHDLFEALLRMHQQARHRGPDGEGFAAMDEAGSLKCAATHEELRMRTGAAPRAGLAFRWLKVQDSHEAARQPACSEDGSVCVIFNGEIYNFRVLRDELATHGHAFRSNGDAEVLVASYLQWGTGMFSRLTGMWSIVILDSRAHTMVIARDRFGIKPLYYRRTDSRLLLASEVKQLVAAGPEAGANLPAVARFILGYRPESPEQTFFEGILAQPAATYAEIDLCGPPRDPEFLKYWQLPGQAGKSAVTSSLESAAQALDALLSNTVLEHLVGPAPTGHLVSGGLDSSLVAALAAKEYGRDGRIGEGFSMVLAPRSRHDESAFIDRVSSHLRFRNHKSEFSAAWLKQGLQRISRAQEEPVAGPAVAAQFLVFELAARNGMRVILDGQGADEIFAGYPRHQFAFLRDCAQRSIGTLLIEGISMGLRSPGLISRAFASFLRGRRARRLAARAEVADLVRSGSRAGSAGNAATLDEVMRNDVLRGNLRAVLALTDRNSMAHSIEARVPYVDHRIVEFAFGLPDRFKVGFGERKRILRKVAARYLPDEVVYRRDRIGFGVPAEDWLRRDFREELAHLPRDSMLGDSQIIDREALERSINGFLAGSQSDWGTAWRLLAVDEWAKAYRIASL